MMCEIGFIGKHTCNYHQYLARTVSIHIAGDCVQVLVLFQLLPIKACQFEYCVQNIDRKYILYVNSLVRVVRQYRTISYISLQGKHSVQGAYA